MLLRTGYFLIIGCSLSCIGPLEAHHSAAAFYDMSTAATVEGRVERIRWVNPHVLVYVRENDAANSGRLWKIEGQAVNTLERQGVNADSIAVGDEISVVGAASRRGRPEMFAGVMRLSDGSEVVLADGIALELGILEQGLSTGEIVTNANEFAGGDSGNRGIFRVWSRRNGGYPLPPETGLRFTSAALAAQEAWDPLTDDTGLQCIPQGMPGVMINPFPIEFIDQGDTYVLRVEEWDAVRTIHMTLTDDSAISATDLGYSIGHWEDNTLVVRTTNISWPYFDDIGSPQTEAMEVIERFTLSDDGLRLGYSQTAFDPVTLVEPAVLTGRFWLEEGAEVKPFNCEYSQD